MKADIFKSECMAIVNPVNCFGVMGAGLALKVKNKYPEVFKKYFESCNNPDETKRLKIGTCLTVMANDGKMIINFPTKYHYKNESKLEYIEKGLEALKRHIDYYKITSIAVPALGAGLGGLKWSEVKPLIEKALKSCKNLQKIEIYDPIQSINKTRNDYSFER